MTNKLTLLSFLILLTASLAHGQCDFMRFTHSYDECNREMVVSGSINTELLPPGPWEIEFYYDDAYYDVVSHDGASETISTGLPLGAQDAKLITSVAAAGGIFGSLHLTVNMVHSQPSMGVGDIVIHVRQGDLIYCIRNYSPDFVEIGITGQTTLLSSLAGNLLASAADSGSTPQNIKLNGRLLVDINYRFFLSEIVMMPGAEIAVSSFRSCRINRSAIYGCENMYLGLTVHDFGELLINQSTIEDALYGSYLEDGCRYGATSTTFLNNIYGIYFEPVSDPIAQSNTQIVAPFPTMQGDVFFNIHFEGNDKMLPPFAGQSEWYALPYTGMLINDMDELRFTGQQTVHFGLENTFTRLNNGIIADNSNLIMNFCTFTDIERNTNIPISGNGIRMTGGLNEGSLTYAGKIRPFENPFDIYINAPSSIYDFNNCYQAIHAVSSDLSLSKMIIQNCTFGISNRRPHNFFFFDESYLTYETRGVELEGQHRFGATIRNNFIGQHLATPPHSFTLDISANNLRSSFSNIIIENNELEPKGIGGIWLSRSEGVEVLNNIIYLNSDLIDKFQVGIAGNSGFGCRMSCNEVNVENGPVFATGIRIFNLSNSLIECNSLADGQMHTGLNINGMSDGTDIIANTMDGTWADMEYGSPWFGQAITGDQPNGMGPNHGNQFFGNANSGFQAIHHSDDLNIVALSEFKVNPNVTGHLPGNNHGTDWFKENSIGHYDCESLSCAPGISNLVPEIETDLYTKIRDGNLYNGDLSDEVLHTGQAHLYKILDGMETVPASFESFYDQMNDQPIGKLSAVRKGINALYDVDPAEVNSTISLINEIKDLNLQWLAGASEENPDINELNQLLVQISEAEGEAQSGLTYNTDWTNSINTLRNQLDEISSKLLIDQNEKGFLEIYLNYLDSEDASLSESDMYDLENIADDCYLLGGDAVFSSRGLLRSLSQDSTGFYDNDDVCLAALNTQEKVTSTENTGVVEESKILHVYPNPAAHQITVDITDWKSLVFYDFAGKQVKSEYRYQDFIDITDLNNGIYQIEVTDRNDSKHSGRIIILK